MINNSNGIALFNKRNQEIIYRNWGFYKVLNTYKTKEENIKIKYLKVMADKNISYQYHNFRDEIWHISSGNGIIIVDGKIKKITSGDIVKVKRGQKHSIKALTDLEIIEIQSGQKTVESDIVRLDKNWKSIVG